ncbi:glutamine-dependent NAD(+) synthetase-like isoform X2 [Gordionus sp. m RMFG-2023]|uniref:glutamine-dependent NAD(+) synthetase-like isoform X2 n=1 Tax=Gordionus sp. m RMFG-2023 TaxID=3053472 RepID=UPI0031FC9128
MLECQLCTRMLASIVESSFITSDGVLTTLDACFGSEICEELWTSDSPNVDMSLDGVEIVTNSSGSLFELRKAHVIVNLIKNVTFKNGGIYMYSNARGCDGDRLYYNGCSCIAMNGSILVQGDQFSLEDVEVLTATVDLDDISAYRNSLRSRSAQISTSKPFPRCNALDFYATYPSTNTRSPNLNHCTLSSKDDGVCIPRLTTPIGEWKYFTPEEEISKAPALWLWDYLRRSGQSGFFLPLSGGLDSSSVACIVYSMCRMVCEALSKKDNADISNELKRILNIPPKQAFPPSNLKITPEWLCEQLLVTCYISSINSSIQTKTRASDLAFQIGSHHLGGCKSCNFSPTNIISVSIDTAVKCIVDTFVKVSGVSRTPRFRSQSSSFKPFFFTKPTPEASKTKDTIDDDVVDGREDIALQNVQARMRMVLSYFFAQLIRWAQHKPGSLLVLGSSNVDECLRGYMTKYDCSSADINPIGGISKLDLKLFLQYCHKTFNLTSLAEILKAKPTAELCPLDSEGTVVQSDEEEMGMTYEELSVYGKLRKQKVCGPYSMFVKLLQTWGTLYPPKQIAQKVKYFFVYYSINRHKMTVLTPSFYAESYSPDDNRFDQRQFLYNIKWTWQFRCIDKMVEEMESQVGTKDNNSHQSLSKMSNFADIIPNLNHTSSFKDTLTLGELDGDREESENSSRKGAVKPSRKTKKLH